MSDVVEANVEPVKKVAFVSRPYSPEDRRKKDEEELEELIKENASEKEPEEELHGEEKTYKKRYGDLRKHQQKEADTYRDKIKKLESQLEVATKKEIKLPTGEKELEIWINQYPDVAAIIESIAIKKAGERSANVEKQLKELTEKQKEVTKEKAEAELLRYHPDLEEITATDEFHDWAEEQPVWIQDALYENDSDAQATARAIDLYKADKSKKKPKVNNEKDAAKAVKTKGERSRPSSNEDSHTFKESDVERMSATEYERNVEAIMESIKTGKFLYDLSGSAR